MKDYLKAFVWTIVILLWLAIFVKFVSAQGPMPSYPLPQSGTITDLGPNGMTTYQYRDHGRTYDAYSPQGYQHQQQDNRGNITRFGPLTPRNDEQDVQDILRQWKQQQ